MTQTRGDKLISAKELSRVTGIPIPTIYRMAEKKRIPYTDATQPWHERRFYRFDPEAVRTALGMHAKAS